MPQDDSNPYRQGLIDDNRCPKCREPHKDGLRGLCKDRCAPKLNDEEKARRAAREWMEVCSKCGKLDAVPGTRCLHCGAGECFHPYTEEESDLVDLVGDGIFELFHGEWDIDQLKEKHPTIGRRPLPWYVLSHLKVKARA
jgi:hypothetical protein